MVAAAVRGRSISLSWAGNLLTLLIPLFTGMRPIRLTQGPGAQFCCASASLSVFEVLQLAETLTTKWFMTQQIIERTSSSFPSTSMADVVVFIL